MENLGPLEQLLAKEFLDDMIELAEHNRSEADLYQDYKDHFKELLIQGSTMMTPSRRLIHQFILAVDFYDLAEHFWREYGE